MFSGNPNTSDRQSKRRRQQKRQRQTRRQSSLVCVQCSQGRDRGQLIRACQCINRLFHYQCLAAHLFATLDQVCPFCTYNYRDRRIIRETDSLGIFGVLYRVFTPRIIIMIVFLISFLKLKFFESYRRNGIWLPICGTFLAYLSNHLMEQYYHIYQRRPHHLIRFTEMSGLRSSVIVDITEQVVRRTEQLENIERQRWIQLIDQNIGKVPPTPQIQYPALPQTQQGEQGQQEHSGFYPAIQEKNN